MSKKSKNYNLDIAMCIPGLPFNGNTLNTKSLGGSETAAASMAKALVQVGHSVNIFTNTNEPGMTDGVIYHNAESWSSYATLNPHDVTIVQRSPESFCTRMASKLNLLWQHDLALLRQMDKFKSVLWNVDKVMTVSQFMTDQYKEVYGLEDDLFWTTRNGIDYKAFKNLPGIKKRNRKQLVCACRPERGWDILLKYIMPKLLAKDPEFKLVLCGYDNPTPQMSSFYSHLHNLAAQFQGRVRWAGNLKKADLYRLYAISGLYVYPTPSPMSKQFCEVSCISMMEAMASGLPFLSSDKGALSETSIEGASSLIEGDPWSEEYQDRFVDEIIAITSDDFRYTSMSKAGRQGSADNDWIKVAEEWTEKMNQFIFERNDKPERLAIHFIQRSDIFAAEKVLENVKSPLAENIKETLKLGWSFKDSRESFKKHYAAMGEITDKRLSENTFTKEHFEQSSEKRFALIKEFLSSKPELKTIVDYGTGHGWHPIYMEKQVGRKWVGIDVDPKAIKWCEKFKEYANEPGNLSFLTGDYLDVTDESNPNFIGKHLPNGKADCLIISEVLEHCIDPVEVVERMEKYVKKNGYVLITVPYGPREYPDYDRIEHRNHIHELDIHSLKEIFEEKPGVDIIGIYETVIPELEEPAGFYMLKYKVDHKPLGKIDWERKVSLQRPAQTLGASLIGGKGCEETLRWSLKSLQGTVSEIVIGDTGLSEEAKNIAREYGCQIIKAPDPLVDGFDKARNATLPYISSDWVFWMDTDEKLHGGNKIFKYLRENLYHGYSIRQHHFAVDTDFKPDLPVRLFRNRPWEGDPIRWQNAIHEHPEAGINKGPGPSIILSDTHISHLGYLHEEGRRIKFWRNRNLLLKSLEQNPDRLLNKHFVMRDNMLLCTYELQENGGKISENIKKLSEETVSIFQENFLGKGTFLNVDSLEYYSQACSYLGLGTEITYCVQPNDSEKKPEMRSYRFASLEDFKKEMDRMVTENVEPRMSKWW